MLYNNAMINIYKGNSFKNCADYVWDSLKRIDQSKLDSHHFVIVPDRASLEAENMMLSALGGSFAVQVFTFRRFFAYLNKRSDNLSKTYLTKQSAIIALTNVIEDNKNNFVCYTKGYAHKGFVESVYETICQLKYCKIAPRQLTADNLPKSLKGKLKDIALIYESYQAFLSDAYWDSADKMDVLAEQVEKTSFIKDCSFYFYDFDNFTAQEFCVLEKLMQYAKDVTVACCVSEEKKFSYLYLNDIYRGALNACEKIGKTPIVNSGESHTTAQTKQIAEFLYTYTVPEKIKNDGFLRIFAGESRVQEVYALACQLQRFVREGNRYKDVYVVTSDLQLYSNAISLVFDEFDIPYFIDAKNNLAELEYSQFVCDFLSLQRNGNLENIITFVKNVFFANYSECEENGIAEETGIDTKSVCCFENYCRKYNVNYDLSKFVFGKEEENFDKADAVRAKLLYIIKNNQIKSSDSIRSYVDAVRRLIDNVSLNKKLAAFASEQEEKTEWLSKVTNQTEEKFEDTLRQLELIGGERVVKLESFIDLLSTALSAIDISVIPAHNDCVVFANMAKARKHDIGFLALLGANQGLMPIVKSDCKLLSNKNVTDMSKYGLQLEPSIYVENRRERFSLYQLLLEPHKKLSVFYCNDNGKEPLLPSAFVNALQDMFCDETLVKIADQNVYSRKQAVAKVLSNARRLKDNQPVNIPYFTALYELLKEEIDKYGYADDYSRQISCGKELFLQNSETSVSKITSFCACPYNFYFSYGLRLKKRKVAEMESIDVGNILHAVLERYVRTFSETETDSITEKTAKKFFDLVLKDDYYAAMLASDMGKVLAKELKKEAVKMCLVVKGQLKNSDFKNYATELEFGTDKDLPAVKVSFGEQSFLLRGKIDRVDVCGNSFIVIDYKSGAASSGYNESDLYVGQKLQLLVYLTAVKNGLTKNGNMKPAGFYYLHLHDDFLSEKENKAYSYNGRTLKDLSVAESIDHTLLTALRSETLGINLTGKREFYKKCATVLTEEQLDAQIAYTTAFIATCGKKMEEGYIAISPLENVCSYCDYKQACDFSEVLANDARKAPKSEYKDFFVTRKSDYEK